MASLYISEYQHIGSVEHDTIQAPLEPSVATQKIAYTSAAASAAFNANTQFIRVIASADVHLLFSANPTATATSMFLPANTVEYFAVNPAQKVSAYDGSS